VVAAADGGQLATVRCVEGCDTWPPAPIAHARVVSNPRAGTVSIVVELEVPANIYDRRFDDGSPDQLDDYYRYKYFYAHDALAHCVVSSAIKDATCIANGHVVAKRLADRYALRATVPYPEPPTITIAFAYIYASQRSVDDAAGEITTSHK
jgi:hypothetical protein